MWEEDARDAMAIRRYRQERRFRREQLWRRMHAESGNRFPDWDDEMDGKILKIFSVKDVKISLFIRFW